MRRDVAVVSFAEFSADVEPARNEVEMLIPLIQQVLAEAGLRQADIGVTLSGSSDYLQGQPFAFVAALDAVGAWPPIRESHVEMDGAFAVYEACQMLQHGDIDTALVYSFGRPTRGNLDRILALQLDPYVVAPLWPDARSLAGLQAQAMRDSGRFGDVAPVPPTVSRDGAAAMVLAVGDRARELTDRPAWIRGIDHRIDPPGLGVRDLTTAPSAGIAARGAGVGAPGSGVDAAWLHAPYPHQAEILRAELGLGDVPVHAEAGAMMVGGLSRLGQAAQAIARGDVRRAVAHATSGACLQQNLVAVLEGAA